MESDMSIGVDEDQYRRQVLLLSSEELETAQQQQLVEEAQQLGLKVPEVEIVASLAASIASGMVDLSSPIISSGSSTDRNSAYEVSVTQAPESPVLDQLALSLSECTLSSGPAKCGSTRSIASPSTRPTSYSSSDGRIASRASGHRNSLLSVASSIDKKEKEKRRSSIKSAIGKIHFRKRRLPSTVLLPPAAQLTVAKGERGTEKIYLESKPKELCQSVSTEEKEVREPEVLKLEIPVFDNAALLQSLANAELRQMRQTQTGERNRHISFQNTLVRELRHRQQITLDGRLKQNQTLEQAKREKNLNDACRMEERQLVTEMEQVREFERAKANSRTRIKYMEGYLSSSSPPPSRSPSISGSDLTPPSRSFTQQHRAQLAQEYHDFDSMDQLHHAKIKVLRDRQELRLQGAIARLERELEALIEKHAMEVNELQKGHHREESTLIQLLDAKKTKLRHRWNLEEAIIRKKLENQDGKPYGPLPPLLFSDSQSDTRDSAICVADHPDTPNGNEETKHYKEF
ncbi:hypothetical protein P175DRAFT_0434945 [Aspergillus ochraceoroseus IBT 24754]|uniref:Uncharacterized protein n=2 Tax=Aspergillus ochraceoroseus TaxID=138278 RepID=A0A2T5LZY2_9EURO|nr:uncharacterized protein P175DRAFT_0434945 [Aspergillus ochraceoroseus IBT 24754]KKK25607.1 hypothetical protein AOCH_003886 [Aspergillus ochraceoroseus]PTU21829.1 hypothetical protein P175DRAFT_0434945 [Aspergillus ochraceoroseus IBT 24754]